MDGKNRSSVILSRADGEGSWDSSQSPLLGMTRAAILLIVLLALSIAIAVSVGATSISWSAIAAGDPTAHTILFGIRLPRIFTGALVGAILAVAGLTFQTLLRNPLADPFILGVSGGAAAGAAVATAFGLARVVGVVPLVAFCGALLATAV